MDENIKENKRFENNTERLDYLNRKQEEIANRQEEELVLDFDEALREENKKKFKVKVNGISYDMPRDMPISFQTFLIRKCYKKIKGAWQLVLPEEDALYTFIDKMFGEKFLRDIERSKNRALSLSFLYNDIIPAVFKQWGLDLDTSTSNIEKKIMSRR